MHIAHLFDQRYGKPRVLRDNLRRNLLKQLARVSVSVSGVCVCVCVCVQACVCVCVRACMWLSVCTSTRLRGVLCRRGRMLRLAHSPAMLSTENIALVSEGQRRPALVWAAQRTARIPRPCHGCIRVAISHMVTANAKTSDLSVTRTSCASDTSPQLMQQRGIQQTPGAARAT